MGRPPLKTGLKTAPLVTRVTEGKVAEIVAIAGEGKTAEFVREAIDEKIAMARRAAALLADTKGGSYGG